MHTINGALDTLSINQRSINHRTVQPVSINPDTLGPPARQSFGARHRILHRDAKRYLNKACYMLIGSVRTITPEALDRLRGQLERLREEIEDPNLSRMDMVDLHSEIVNTYLDLSIRLARG